MPHVKMPKFDLGMVIIHGIIRFTDQCKRDLHRPPRVILMHPIIEREIMYSSEAMQSYVGPGKIESVDTVIGIPVAVTTKVDLIDVIP